MTASPESKPARLPLRTAVVISSIIVAGCSDSTPPPVPATEPGAASPPSTPKKPSASIQPGEAGYSGKGPGGGEGAGR